jgi:VWFA-related protein
MACTLLVSPVVSFSLIQGMRAQETQVIVPSEQKQVVTTPSAQDALPAPSDTATMHITATTRRTSVDVVVIDDKGKPVSGFTRADFTVYEDGVPQALRSFDPHTPGTQSAYVQPKIPKLPPNTFLNLSTAPASGTPTVLLYDVINTPVDALMYAHVELLRYLKHRKPGTQVAIFVLSDKLHLLQGFTDDDDVLMSALDKKNGHVSQSKQLGSAGSTASSAQSLSPTTAANPPAGAPTTSQNQTQPTQNQSLAQAVSGLESGEALEQSYMLDQRIDITLAGLTEIGRFLAGLPGRKNLIWLSGSFPTVILPDSNITVNSLGQDLATRNYGDQIKEATDLLNLSHVAVYPVDVRGIVAPPNTGPEIVKFISDQALERSTMDSIAESTGGHAYYQTNDVEGAVDHATENGSTYYTMTYSPTNMKLDGGLRKIKVKLDKPGYTLSYRTSYYADDLQKAAQEVADAPQSPLSPALERGTPVSHELFIEARLQAVGEPVAATPKQMEMLATYESMRATKKKGKNPPTATSGLMMQSYLITYGLLPRQLQMQLQPDGAHKTLLEMGVLSYDQDGRKLNGSDTRIEDDIPAKRFATLSDEGYHLYQTVAIPVTAASLRLAVRDTSDNRIGSLEVQLPLAKTP